MDTNKPLHIFKPGRQTAMNGVVLDFSEADLAASAAAYDPALSQAPIVVGHPRTDAPAYGWVKSMAFGKDGLFADPEQVDPAFAELVNAGRYKKISASFYTPDSPNNPVPGVYYLRHVGFLGAQPPAVKGLRTPEFAEGEEGIVEFGELPPRAVASLFRGLRDWLIGKFGQDEADKVLPGWDVDYLQSQAAQPDQDDVSPIPSFSEPTPKENTVTPEEKAAIEAENAQLKAQLAAANAEKAQAATTARHAAHAEFAEGLIKAGQLLPAHKDLTVATLDFMAGQDQVVEFGEGDAKQPLADAFKGFLSALPPQVSFGEHQDKGEPAGVADFAAAPGYTVDSETLALHQKALAYQQQNQGVDYLTAVRHVEKQQ